MARSQCPSTPFSTPLSGSARQAEARIRNLFQGPKRRPPVWLMVLVLLLILSCGGLVACQSQEAPPLEGDCVHTGKHNAPSARLIQAVLDRGLSALDLTSPPVSQVLATLPGNGCALAAVSLSDGSSHYILAIGVVQESAGAVGPVFLVQGQGCQPHAVPFQQDGTSYLLYTANSLSQWLSQGESGLLAFDGTQFTWVWPVEGDVREEGSAARAAYDSYWENALALLAPGGVDVFARTDYAVIDGDGPQWLPDHNEQFYTAPEDQLNIGIYYQTRVWLEDFTRSGHNPWNAHNASASWQILSLAPTDGSYPGRNDMAEASYDLLARADADSDLYLAARIRYSPEEGCISVVQGWSMGSYSEVEAAMQALPEEDTVPSGLNSGKFYALVRQYLSARLGADQIFFSGWDQLSPPQEGDLLLTRVDYLGSAALADNTVGSVYTMESMQFRAGSWVPQEAPFTLVLSRSAGDGVFLSVAGEAISDPAAMSLDEVARQPFRDLYDPEIALFRDGWPTPAGPGLQDTALFFSQAGVREELPGEGLVQNEGDMWVRYSWDGFSADYYHLASDGSETLRGVETTRTDVYTLRGIRVGDSRQQVLASYPALKSESTRNPSLNEMDCMWYCEDMDNDQGLALLFFFEGEHVSRIVLTRLL